jgi:hypothetical protein
MQSILLRLRRLKDHRLIEKIVVAQLVQVGRDRALA